MLLSNDPDFLLIQRVIKQDLAAFSTLYDKYAWVVYAAIYHSLGSTKDSEEVVIEVFEQIWRTAIFYDFTKTRVDRWIFMMTRRQVLKRLLGQ